MGKLRAFFARLPRGILPWMVLSFLFAIGTITAVAGVMAVPKQEMAVATKEGQRVTVDPATGKMTGLAKKAAEKPPAVDEEAVAHEPPKTPEPAAEPKVVTSAAAESVIPEEESKASDEAAPEKPEEKPSPPSAMHGEKLATHAAVAEIPKVRVSGESIVAPGAIEITESLHGQPVPKLGAQGLSASTLYAKSFAPTPELTRVSIVLTDAGFNAQSMAAILKLPRMVTVSFSPYAPGVQANITKLHAAGFETWGMLPTMGEKYPKNDPGPLGLIASLPPEEVIRRLRTVMSNTLGAVGMVLPPDEALSANSRAYGAVVNEITGRGLWLLSTHPTRALDAASGGDKKLLPSLRRADMVIDANVAAAEIQSKLDSLKTLAQKKSRIIVVMPARPMAIEQLADWLNHNGLGKTAELAPLSAMYRIEKAPEPAPEAAGHGAKSSHEAPKDDTKESHGAH